MANSILDLEQLAGLPKRPDSLHIIDSEAAHPRDRRVPFGTLLAGVANPHAGAPTVDDDETEGYLPGMLWLDTTGPTLYMVTDVSAGAAVWRVIVDWS